jgi:hypothetical protein
MSISLVSGYVTGTEQTRELFQCILQGYYIHVIHQVYTRYIPCIYLVYIYVIYVTMIMLIAFLSFLPARFRGQHFSIPAGNSSPLDISHPDPKDDEDMDIPDQQALMDASMAVLAKESDFCSLSQLLATLFDPTHGEVEAMSFAEETVRGLIPEASDETLQAFSYSEMKLYKHAIAYKWTVDELIATIKFIKSTDFKVEDVNIDLHRCVAAAIAKGHFTSLNMRESELDGNQDLILWIRSLEEVLRGVLGNDRMAGHQHLIINEESCEREFGPSISAVSFQLAQVRVQKRFTRHFNSSMHLHCSALALASELSISLTPALTSEPRQRTSPTPFKKDLKLISRALGSERYPQANSSLSACDDRQFFVFKCL